MQNSKLGEILEEGGSFAKAAASQIIGGKNKQAADIGMANKKTEEEFVKKMYGSSSKDELQQGSVSDTVPAKSQESLEEEAKKEELRKKLHDESYYNPTFNPVKNQEEKQGERVEREKQEEMQELRQEEAEKLPPVVDKARNRVERLPGTSG